MAALTPTLVESLDVSAGTKKLKLFTVTPQADGDTIDMSTWFSQLDSVHAQIIAGLDANFTIVEPSFSGTDITLVELKADGTTSASDWTGASISLWVIGEDAGI